MKRWMVAIASMGLLLGVQAGVLVSSDGAWSSAGVIGSSNGGAQTNQNAGGGFGNYGGPSFNVNAESIVMDMQATVSNMLPVYTEGYTYNYKASSCAANVSMATNQVVYLLANGSTVAGSRVSGPNNTGIYGSNDRPTISGSVVVASGDPLIGQTIGVRLSSEGVQSRFRADGSSGLSAVLTDHFGFNGDGVIYSTSFETNSSGLIATDHVLDMVLSGVGVNAGYISMNSNDSGGKNTATLASAEDTFRGDGRYTITFDAKKQIDSDSSQNDLSVTLGSFTTNVTIATAVTTYTVEVDADAAGITGDLLSIVIQPAGTPASGIDQFRLYDLTISVPPPAVDPFVLPADPGSLIANGGFSAVTDTNGAPLASGGYNIEGTFGDFSFYWGAVAEVTGWAPYYDDPNDLRLRVVNVHSNDLGADILDGTFYLDTLVNADNDTVTLNSSMDYKNGLVQTDLFNGLTVKAGATYQFGVDAYQSNPGTDQSSATFTAALTADSTDTADAVGSAISLAATNLPTAGGTLQTNAISGVDLLAALAGGPVNVIFEQVNTEAIAGYPASADAKDPSQVSQVRIADISLILNIPELDLNKDGVADVDDVTHLNSYLDGSVDGGDDAETRQNDLIALGFSPAEALDYLNLTDYDFNGDETYDAADITYYQGLVAGEDVVIEDIYVDGSGNIAVDVGGLFPGNTYYLMRSSDLVNDSFDEIVDSAVAPGLSATLTDTNAPADSAFYRVTD